MKDFEILWHSIDTIDAQFEDEVFFIKYKNKLYCYRWKEWFYRDFDDKIPDEVIEELEKIKKNSKPVIR